jgi:hypothetical protein
VRLLTVIAKEDVGADVAAGTHLGRHLELELNNLALSWACSVSFFGLSVGTTVQLRSEPIPTA